MTTDQHTDPDAPADQTVQQSSTQAPWHPFEISTSEGIATITLRSSTGVNQINPPMVNALRHALEETVNNSQVRGVILTSAHKEFCVGADLNLFRTESVNAQALRELLNDLNRLTRYMETQGKPVVVALNGSALGGGYELALACHHRVALNLRTLRVGLPEVMLGLLPGAGGTQRLPRLIGIQPALELITQGKTLSSARALKAGLIDELAEDIEELMSKARTYIDQHPKATQPWDRRNFQYPAHIQPNTLEARQLFMGASAMLYQKTAGAHIGPRRVVEVVQEAAHLKLDAALNREAAAFVEVASQPEASARMRTLWFHKRSLEKGTEDLHITAEDGIQKVSILGAGMMGAELAYLCAQAGKQVVLKDIKAEALERGVTAYHQLLKKNKKLSESDRQTLLTRFTPSLELEELRGSDLVIEAVFEDLKLKHRVIQEVEPLLAEGGIFASNTSALPITDLAQVSQHPDRFIGLHFFSPASVMPLVEIIEPEATSPETLSRAWRFCRAIKKVPIIVGDGYGFFTTRVFAAYILEAAECLAQGYPPALIEWAARTAGMAVSPLKVFDEVTLTLGMHAMEMRELYKLPLTHQAGLTLLKKMVDLGRLGRASGAGFYDHSQKPRRLWSGLGELCAPPKKFGEEITLPQVEERLLLTQALEATRCLEDGVLRHPADGDVGAILGLGFAPNTGGPFSWMDQKGIAWVVQAAHQWVERGVSHFDPPQLLIQMAAKGERFFS